MISDVLKIIVVEYSLIQKSFHKISVSEMLDKNKKNVMAGIQTDYLPIRFFYKDEDADNFIMSLKNKFNDKNGSNRSSCHIVS